MMDVVYFLGPGSKHDDWELRYSLRALIKNFKDLGSVYIIGNHKPSWLVPNKRLVLLSDKKNDSDPYKSNKDANLINKLIRAALHPHLSDVFLSASDDTILLRETTAQEMRLYYNGDLAEKKWKATTTHKWQKRRKLTFEMLKKRGHPTRDFDDAHIPLPIAKQAVHSLLSLNYGEGVGYVVYTAYGNVSQAALTARPMPPGWKTRFDRKQGHINDLETATWLSFNDDGLGRVEFKSAIEAKFPKPSPWEMSQPESNIKKLPIVGFNPGVIDHKGKRLLAYRKFKGKWQSKLFIGELKDGEFINEKPIKAPEGETFEDPRLFVLNGQLHTSVTRLHHDTKGRVAMALINLETGTIANLKRLQPKEKNWQFFEYDGETLIVYSPVGNEIKSLDGNTLHKTESYAWNFGEPRGSTPPILINGEYWSIFHSSKKENGVLRYHAGMYAFDAEPPFRISRWPDKPFLSGSMPPPGRKSVVFPCGAILDERGCWFITYGKHDREAWSITIPHSDFENKHTKWL